MSKNNNGSKDNYYHNKGEADRANSSDGKGQDNYHPPHNLTGGVLLGDKDTQDRREYDKGWDNHRQQTKK